MAPFPSWRTSLVLLVGALASFSLWRVAMNLLNAVERGRQKRTMGDLRTLGTALESYSIDVGAYPDVATVRELVAMLEPTYVRRLPLQDGWDQPLQYRAWSEESGALVPCPCTRYSLWSAGPDGVLEHDGVPSRTRQGPLESTESSRLTAVVARLRRWAASP